ncbi:bifunctional 2',3'-cyclic nucleotide 2'-phosphodiesterase/3'-nucleotidase [Coprothermobacteraceae bacterium]|nr:bifunctional 2',3'-cyclic nucleotide 2'-phosphodiesterase/3'-nucleotidase [Coprothermobacteraceae bacterium]
MNAESTVTITILETSDLHGRILAYDYGKDVEDQTVGLAKVATYVNQVRSQNPNIILVDNGDFMQGTPIVENYLGKPNNPLARVMNYLKYDAVVIGNHEFNFGMAALNAFAKDLSMPLISANVVKAGTTDPYFKPYVVVERGGIKIGILGLTTLVVKNVEKPANYEGVDFADPVAMAKKYVGILRNDEKVDLVVLSAHSGLEYDPDTKTYSDRVYPENFVYKVLQEVSGIDAVLTGHDHYQLAKIISTPFGTTVPVVQPSSWGKAVGRVDITLSNESGAWKVKSAVPSTFTITASVAQDASVADMVKTEHGEVLTQIRTPIGEFTADFPQLDFLTSRMYDSAYYDLQMKAMEWAAGTDIAIQAMLPNIPPTYKKGPITIKDINALYIYANTLYKVRVTGKMIKDLLEESAKMFVYTYDPLDGPKLSADPNFRGYNFDAADGIEYKIDVTRPVGDRVIDMKYKGQPLDMNGWYVIAINNYRFQKMSTTILKGAEKLWEGDLISDYIVQYVKEKKQISPESDNNWSIAPAYLLSPEGQLDYATLQYVGALEAFAGPKETLTRASAACLIKGTYAKDMPITYIPSFKDYQVNEGDCIVPLLSSGIYVGYGDGTVRPNAPLTREQAAIVAIRGMRSLQKLPDDKETEGILSKYVDGVLVSPWARRYVAAAIKFGWLKTDGNKIRPSDQIKEGELVYLLHWSRYPNVRMFSINDFHGNISTFYSDSSLKATVGGYETIAWYINKYKADNPLYTYFFDVGDLMQGTPTSTVLRGEPLIALHNAMKLDAMAVGNHEFDWGVDLLKDNISKAQFPIISSNIYEKSTGKPVDWARPYVILNKGYLNVGVVGYTSPETSITAHPSIVGGFDFKDPSVAGSYIQQLRKKSDLVIVLAHEGAYVDSKSGLITGDNILKLANYGPDALFTGHSHTTVAGFVGKVPVVQAWYNGRRIGAIAFLYDALNGKILDTKAAHVAPIVTSQTKVPEIASIIKKYDDQVGPVFGVAIGYTKNGFTRNYYGESNLGDFVSDIMLDYAKKLSGRTVDAAFQNAGGLRIDIPTGTITIGTIWALMPFDNTIVVMDLTGADVKALLERSCLKEGESDAGGASKGQLQPAGIRWVCDMSKPIGSRVESITFESGKAFTIDGVYTVATNDFLATGGDGFNAFKNGKNFLNTFKNVRDAIIETVQAWTAEGKTIDYPVVGRITIK